MIDRDAIKGSLSSAFTRLVQDIDLASVEAEVSQLRASHPGADEDELSEILTRRSAIKAASTGAIAGAAGGVFALAALAPDVWNLLRQQSRLVLGISLIWGVSPTPEERVREVFATLATATGTALARRGAARLAERAVTEALLKRMFGKLVARRAATLAPVAGSAIGGAANWLAVQSVGRAARSHYRKKRSAITPPGVE